MSAYAETPLNSSNASKMKDDLMVNRVNDLEVAQAVNNAADLGSALAQGFKDWNTFLRSSVGQRYVDFRLNVLIDFIVFFGERTYELRAMCSRLPDDPLDGGALEPAKGDDIRKKRAFLATAHISGKAAYGPDPRAVACRVCLQPVDKSHDLWSGPIYVSRVNGCLSVAFPPDEWEHDAASVASLLADLRTDSLVKGGPKVNESVFDEEAHRAIESLILRDEHGGERLHNPLGLHIALDDYAARVRFEERPDCRIEVSDVLLGPINWDERLFRHAAPLRDLLTPSC